MAKYISILAFIVVEVFPFFFSHQQQLFSLSPDIFRSTPELIESRGFRSEQHRITTEDGYILQLFRIRIPEEVRLPESAKAIGSGRPVLLWHGLAVDSDSWLYTVPDGQLSPVDGKYRESGKINDCRTVVTDTLAYTLAACGYDVWLANSRGGKYADQHVNLTRADVRFWRYTLTELAIFDVPAVIRYILHESTGHRSLAYIGHSLGTDQMFALQSLIPESGQLIRPFVALAPVAYLGHIWSVARLGVPLEPVLRKFPGPLGVPTPVMQAIGSLICGNDKLVDLCRGVLFSINGFDPANFNRSIVPADVAHAAITTSTWLYGHLAQMVRTGRYQLFDYGTSELNFQRYGRPDPPDYPLEKIRSPDMALFRGRNDPLADVPDVNWLVNRLNVTLLDDYTVPYDWWNHQDFQLGTTQGFFINQRLLAILAKFHDHHEKPASGVTR